MKTKHTIKILLDIIMLVIYILLMFGYSLDPYFHEIFGILIGIIFLVHIGLNFKETKMVLKSLWNKNSKFEKKVTAVSDILLIISMPIAIITGVMISGVILNMTFNNGVYAVHYFASYISLGIMLMHFALHIDYFLAVLLRSIKERKSIGVKKAIKTFAAISAIVLTLYVSANNYFKNIALPIMDNTNVSDNNEDDGQLTAVADETPTLSEYLSNLYCTACPRNCSLLAPMCSKGVAQAAAAEVDYYEEYEMDISTLVN